MPCRPILALALCAILVVVSLPAFADDNPLPGPFMGFTPLNATGDASADQRDFAWFGGDDGGGLAYLDGVWDWDAVGDDPMQGWVSSYGSYVSVVPQEVWDPWLQDAGFPVYPHSGNALSFTDVESSPYWPPGIPPGTMQAAGSGVLARSGYEPPYYNTVLVRWNSYLNFPMYRAGTFFRPGYQYYPNAGGGGEQLWSPRLGQDLWFYADAYCGSEEINLSTLDGLPGDPIPVEWDSMRVTYEVWTDCDAWGISCSAEGDTRGSPLLDNMQIGLGHTPTSTLSPDGLEAVGAGRLVPTRPNPTAGYAEIRFNLTRAMRVSLDIYDSTGRLVRTLLTADFPAGEHINYWDGVDDLGRRVGSGVFWAHLSSADGNSSKIRLMLLR